MAVHWKTADSVAGTAVLLVGHKCEVSAVRTVNTTAAAAYLQLFDAATAATVTVGTTLPHVVVKALANDPGTDDFYEAVIFQNGVVVASTTTALGSTGASQHVRVALG